MRKNKIILTVLLIFLFVGQLVAQKKLTSSEWQEDLKYLQRRIHDDYHPLFLKITEKEFN